MKKLIVLVVLTGFLASCYRPPHQAWQPKKSFSVDHGRKKRI
jgi:hypothetical protein